MKAHQTSLAEQTLWKIIAERIEKVHDQRGNNLFIYHLTGLKKYRELHDLQCEPDLVRIAFWTSSEHSNCHDHPSLRRVPLPPLCAFSGAREVGATINTA